MSDSVRPHRWQPTRLRRPCDSPGKNTGMGCHVLLQCMIVKSESEVAQLCPTLCDPMDCSLPGSSIHGIFQARVLEWGVIAFSGVTVYRVTKSRIWLKRPNMQDPGEKGSLGENGYMDMYDWVPSLSTWNCHNIVNWLYSDTTWRF